MSIILGALFGSSHATDLTNPAAWLTSWAQGRKSKAGPAVGPTTAMALPAYFGCIRNVSEDSAKIPLKLYRRLDRGKELATGHPIARLLRNPNPAMSGVTFREILMHYALGWGNGFAEIQVTSGGDPVALWPLHSANVTVKQDEPDGPLTYLVNTGQDIIEVEQDRMIHLRGLGDMLEGYSVARLGVENLGKALAAQNHAAAFLGNGARMSGILLHPRMKDENLRKLKDKWRKDNAGSDNVGNTGFLPHGFDYKALSIPPEEAQLLETMKFSIEDVARWFRMPPHKIQHLDSATFSNIEQQSIEYVTDTLQPWLTRFEHELSRKLLRDEADDLFLEHMLTGLLRGDSAARSAYYRELWRIGVLSINEIREKENENPVEHGDKRLVPLEMGLLETAGEPQEPAAASTVEVRPRASQGAQQALLADRVQCLAQFTTDKAKRMARKGPERFWQWLHDEMGADLQPKMVEILSPACGLLAELNNVPTADLFGRYSAAFDAAARDLLLQATDCQADDLVDRVEAALGGIEGLPDLQIGGDTDED